MHRFSAALIAAVSAVAFTQIAAAADMPRKAPAAPPPPPVYTWSGCYIGGNIGGAWSRQTSDFVAVPGVLQVPGSIDQNANSVIGGVHLGCNYQFDPKFVVGAEGDWSWTGLNGSGSAPNIFSNTGAVFPGGINMSSDTKWMTSLRGRLGWVVMPQAMIYATGGAAWAKTDYAGLDANNTGCPTECGVVSFSNTKSGWVVGGGAEYMLTPNWFVRAEYLYYQFSGASAIGYPPQPGGRFSPFAAFNWSDLKVNEVRAGISYKFF